jgi:uncharacterized protein (TIGR03118 family)
MEPNTLIKLRFGPSPSGEAPASTGGLCSMNRLHCRTTLAFLVLLASTASVGRAGNVSVLQTDLVVDSATTDPSHTTPSTTIDPVLINPWGVSFAGGSPFWVSDNNSGFATLYNSAGGKISPPSPAIPISNGMAFDNANGGPEAGTTGTPTGQVASGAFTIPGHGASAFIFATEGGTIAAWNGGIGGGNANNPAVTVVDNSNHTDSGAVYKGLAADTVNGSSFLLAANFRGGTIDIFDQNFGKLSSIPGGGAFVDPNLPAGYAPFNVAVLNGKVYVTYALQDPASGNHDDKAGLGNGIVDVYSTNGTGLQRLISNGNTNLFGGALDSPWGLAIAPSSFGSLGGDLLVGNFGNGWINAFNPTTGNFDGFLATPTGAPVVNRDLWTITPGGSGNDGNPNTLYFTAGGLDESQGIFGSLTAVPEPAAVIQALTGATGLSLYFFLRRKLHRPRAKAA